MSTPTQLPALDMSTSQPLPASQSLPSLDMSTSQPLSNKQPNAGLAPAAGSPTSQPMVKSYLQQALNPEDGHVLNPMQPAEAFALNHPDEQGKLLGAAAIGAAGAALPFAAPIAEHVAGQILEHGTELATKYPNFVKLAGKLVPGLPLSTVAAITYAYEHFKK